MATPPGSATPTSGTSSTTSEASPRHGKLRRGAARRREQAAERELGDLLRHGFLIQPATLAKPARQPEDHQQAEADQRVAGAVLQARRAVRLPIEDCGSRIADCRLRTRPPVRDPQLRFASGPIPIYNSRIRHPIRHPIRSPQSAVRNTAVGVLTLACALGAQAPQAEHAHRPASSATALEIAQRPVTIRTGIGSAHDAVATASKDAQAFYDQGLAYLHSYVWIEAARSFNQALRVDPKLALAHLGLTVAYVELNAAPAAHAALERAKALASTDHDRRHVAARALQMAAEEAPRDDARLTAYRASLDQALAEIPAGRRVLAAARPGRVARSGRARAGQRRRVGAASTRRRWRSLPDTSPRTTT